jgi:uncharacterized protein Veg
LLFENVSSKKQKFEMITSSINLHQMGNKLIIQTNNNSKKEFKNKNNLIDGNNSFIELNKNKKNMKNLRKKYLNLLNNNMVNVNNSQSDIIKNSISNNKSNLSLNKFFQKDI